MKKNKLENTLGIEIDQGVFYEEPGGEAKSQQNIFDYIMKLCLVFIGCIGMMCCLGESYDIIFDSIFVAAGAALASLYFFAVFSAKKGARLILTAVGTFLLILLLIFHRQSWASSLRYIYTMIAQSFNSYYSISLPLFREGTVAVGEGSLAMLLLLIPVCVPLSLSAARPCSSLITAAAFVPWLVIILVSGHVPEAEHMYLVLGSLLGFVMIRKTAFCGSFLPEIRTDHASQRGLRGLAVLMMLFFFAVSIYLGRGLFYPRVESILGPVRDTVYSSSIRELYEQLLGRYSAGGINGGQINGGNSLRFNHEVHLLVSVDADIRHYSYLKGYVGEVYDGAGWDPLPDAAYETESFQALANYDESFIMSLGYHMIRNVYDIVDNQLVSSLMGDVAVYYNLFYDMSPIRWRIQAPDLQVSDSEYLCLPYYGLVSQEDGDISNLTYLTRRNGNLENLYDAYFPDTNDGWSLERLEYLQLNLQRLRSSFENDLDMMPDQLADLKYFMDLEQAYRQFVYEQDLQVPERLDRLVEEYGGYSFDSIGEAVTFVQQEVARESTYTLTPERCPAGEDFIEYFLFESREGYCTHFASAAVMIFRCLGIPARYVQGYVIPPMSADTQVSVDDSYAHAWPEIYIDGFGWIPVEVTPGYNGNPGGFTPEMNQDGYAPPAGSAETESDSAETPGTAEEEITLPQLPPEEAPTTADPDTEEESGEETTEEGTDTAGTSPAQGETGPGASGTGDFDSQGTDPGSSGTEISSKTLRLIRNILTALLILLLICGFLYSHRRTRIFARRRKFTQRSCRNSCLAIYRELCHMSARYHVPVDEAASPHDLSLFYPVEEKQWRMVLHIAQEAVFSDHEITEEKKQVMLAVYRKCCRYIDEKLSWYRRMAFRIWDGYR